MRCTSPLYRVKDFVREGADAPSVLIKKRFFNYKDFLFLTKKSGIPRDWFTRINCGQCLSCRLLAAKQWSERCYLEGLSYKNSYFVTLTYDDDHLPYSTDGIPTLQKRDVQLFFKRLRKHFGKCRYFLGAEYGDESYRPHYHILLYGIEINDLVLYKQKPGKLGLIQYFNSKSIEDIWQKGFVVITRLTPETCLYTAQYSMKKLGVSNAGKKALNGEDLTDKEYHSFLQYSGEIEKTFSLMSRRPGIGRDFYEKNKQRIYKSDRIPGSVLKHLRYFDKIYEKEDPVFMIGIKEERSKTFDVFSETFNSDLTEDQILETQQRVMEANKRFRGN